MCRVEYPVDLSEIAEYLEQSEVTVRQLDAANPADRRIAQHLDDVSEGLNPFDASYKKMSPGQIKRWVTDSDTNFLRVIEVPVEGSVEPQVIGFVYFDIGKDSASKRRAREIRQHNGLAEDHQVWEMNFWVPEGTGDIVVIDALKQTLGEFEKRQTRSGTSVYYADAGDMMDAYKSTISNDTNPRNALQSVANRTIAEKSYQDTRVLAMVGFGFSQKIEYFKGLHPLDFAYTTEIGPQTVISP